MEATWHHVAISVEDMDRALHFYRDLLGFGVDWEKPGYSGDAFAKVVGMPDAGANVVMLKGFGGRIELFKYLQPAGGGTAVKQQCDFGLTHFALSVKNLQSIYDSLVQHGVEFNCPPQNLRPGVWGTYMKDPEGNTIELVQYP